jgi:hypothetical protein
MAGGNGEKGAGGVGGGDNGNGEYARMREFLCSSAELRSWSTTDHIDLSARGVISFVCASSTEKKNLKTTPLCVSSDVSQDLSLRVYVAFCNEQLYMIGDVQRPKLEQRSDLPSLTQLMFFKRNLQGLV